MPLAQLLGIERGNPIGIFLVIATSLAILGWWVYYYPQGRAAKHLIELRQQFADWQAAATKEYEALWREKLELMKRYEAAEGKLARWKAKYEIDEE